MIVPKRGKATTAKINSQRARWRRVRFKDNRVVREHNTIGASGCWCGLPGGHNWNGKEAGSPHPRPTAQSIKVFPTAGPPPSFSEVLRHVMANRVEVLEKAAPLAARLRCGVRVLTQYTGTSVQVVAQVDPSLAEGEVVDEFVEDVKWRPSGIH